MTKAQQQALAGFRKRWKKIWSSAQPTNLGVRVYESEGCLQTESSKSKLNRALRRDHLVGIIDGENRRNFMS
jgi:hypothetical protein